MFTGHGLAGFPGKCRAGHHQRGERLTTGRSIPSLQFFRQICYTSRQAEPRRSRDQEVDLRLAVGSAG
jgi:hypothetical protein